MHNNLLRFLKFGLLVVAVAFAGCDGSDGVDGVDGQDGQDGAQGPPGPPGPAVINASQVSEDFLDSLDVETEVVSVTIASAPVVIFTLKTSTGVPITGLVPFWEDSNRFVRFTIDKLVTGMNGEPNIWVSYVRDAGSNEPDYDTGSSLIDNGDGSYTFTFNTDVAAVAGVPYEPTLTHRVAGQIGSGGVPLEAQNFYFDFVPAGGAVTVTRRIAVMDSCNECHENLVFHGRRFKVEYCVTCHNPDLASGEGNFPFMIHRIHSAGSFAVLDGGIDFSELTYPQDLANCRKCHNGLDAATPDGDNWKNRPHMVACDGCHNNFSTGTHTGGPQADNSLCLTCHPASAIEQAHITPNPTPNNPLLLPNQRNITYELVDATVDGANNVTINFRILSDGTPLDMTNLPPDLTAAGRYPSFLLAWALPQDGIDEPMDYNNQGGRAGQPRSVGIDDLSPIEVSAPVGNLTYNPVNGVNTAVITDPAEQFPVGATLRAVGLQSYFEQDLDGDGTEDESLHTPSVVIAVTGDDARRKVVDGANCGRCHERLEMHGGSRVHNIQICTMCHVPNLSSTGRTVTDPTARGLDQDLQDAIDDGTLDPSVDPSDPTTYPEDAQFVRDLVHGIHSVDFRTRPFQHVRGPNRQGYYDHSHITFPRGASTRNCELCHEEGTYELPLGPGRLSSTVRTTGVADGQDADVAAAEAAFQGVPNDTDWINTPTAGSCFYCHTSVPAMAHMMQNGGLLSLPTGGGFTNRISLVSTNWFESCEICHGPGRTADLDEVHDR